MGKVLTTSEASIIWEDVVEVFSKPQQFVFVVCASEKLGSENLSQAVCYLTTRVIQ